MKKFILNSLIVFITVSGFSQGYDLVNVVVWEADAKSGGKFFGIAPDKHEAQNAIDELTFIKEGTKYELNHSEINIIPVLVDKNVSVKEDFISDHDYLEYKYISEIELIAIEYMEKGDINMAISFYTNVVREKSKTLAEKHLNILKVNYSKYIFDHNPNDELLSYVK